MREIPGFEGYKIDENGNVYSLFIKRMMKAKVSKDGYRSVGLSKMGKYHWFNCHRLVLLTFFPIPENVDYLQACHIDGEKSNNHISNLRWDTPKGNTQDKYRHGTAFMCKEGEAHYNARLNSDMVVRLRIDAQSENCMALSEKYGIPRLTIYDAVVGNSWKSVNARQNPVDLSGRQHAAATRSKLMEAHSART